MTIDESRINQYYLLLQTAFCTGFLLGGYGPARRAALQFHAEHQHNPPQNDAQAVVYYRRRNYRMMAAFGQGGAWRGMQVATVGMVWVLMDAVLSHDYLNSTGMEIVKGVVTGSVCGSLFGLAGRGHRLYYARKGVLFGGALGAGVGALREIANRVNLKE